MDPSNAPAPAAADRTDPVRSPYVFIAVLFLLAFGLRLAWVMGVRHTIEFPDEKPPATERCSGRICSISASLL